MTEQTKIDEAAAEADRLASAQQEKPGDVVPTDGALPALTPEQLAMMRGDSGKQKFAIRELMVPVLKISNTTSGVMKKSDPEYRKEAEEGDFYDSLTFQFYKPPVDIIVVRFQTTYIQSKPKMGPTTKLWGMDRSGYDRAHGGDVGVRTTKEGDEIREVGTYYTLMMRPDGSSMPCLMYLGSTSWKEARRLNALLGGLELMGEDGPFIAPPYARLFKALTVPTGDGKNTWMTWKFNMGPMTLAIPQGLHYYKRAKELEEAIDANRTRIVGTQDDERFAEGQEARKSAQEVGSGPPTDEPPPPTSEGDYGGANATQETVKDKAAKAPF
jgi:hypothetical protein